MFAVPYLPDQVWQGRGPTLTRYAKAVFGDGEDFPAVDETCAAVGNRLNEMPARREIIVSYHHWCGPLPNAETTISREFRFPVLPPIGFAGGRVSADLLIRDPPAPDTTMSRR